MKRVNLAPIEAALMATINQAKVDAMNSNYRDHAGYDAAYDVGYVAGLKRAFCIVMGLDEDEDGA